MRIASSTLIHNNNMYVLQSSIININTSATIILPIFIILEKITVLTSCKQRF